MEGMFGSGNIFGIAESEPYYPGQHLSTGSSHHHSYYYPSVKQEEFDDDDVFSPSSSYGAEQEPPLGMSNLSYSVHLTPPFENSQYFDNLHHHQQQDVEQEIDRQFKMIEEVIYKHKSDYTPPTSTSNTTSNIHDLYEYDPHVTSISVKRERREDGNELGTVTMSPTSASSLSSSSRATSCEETSDDQAGEDRKWAQMLSNKSKRSSKRHPILSWFLFNALECPDVYGSMIWWVDRKRGIFEFSSENKERLARQWGVAKNNRKPMTYQKLARALRIYIKKNRVLKKMNKKLQYIFLPSFLKVAKIEARFPSTAVSTNSKKY